MDQTLPLAAAPAPLPQAAAPVELPWEVEEVTPVRAAPRKTAQATAHPVAPERLHWPMIALTVITAITLVFATRASDDVHTWEFPTPAEQVR